MIWNHNISEAPRDGSHVILAMPNKTTLRSYWCEPKNEPAHWCMLSHKNEPVAFMLWPEHPFANSPQQQGTDGGEIALAHIQLDKGKVAVVDASDFERLSNSTWFAVKRGKTFYAARSPLGKMEYMHRVIIGASDDQLVDHENRDGLDNRRSNIRISTAGENAANADLRLDNTSGFKGVCAAGSRWTANIRVRGKKIYLGSFDTAQQAADAYDNAAIEAFGEFALLNRTIRARLANAAGVEPSPSDHFILEDVGGGA